MARKFYKINGLDGTFKYNSSTAVYNTGLEDFTDAFIEEYIDTDKIDEHTILFITANEADDERKVNIYVPTAVTPFETQRTLSSGDTMIWARGALYGLTQKSVTNLDFDTDTRNLVITYSDGTIDTIEQGALGMTAKSPLHIDSDNRIELFGMNYDANNNFIENPLYNDNGAQNNCQHAHIEGRGCVANADYQHVQGKFNSRDSNSIFIIGNGASANNTANVFTVGYDGTTYSKTDVTAGASKQYKLSDIHSVVSDDWTDIEN